MSKTGQKRDMRTVKRRERLVREMRFMAEASAYAGDATAAARYLLRAEEWERRLEEARLKQGV